MLIVNADDYGRSELASDAILQCFANQSISSTSAMVFMKDSDRAATLAQAKHLDIGLHLNFSETFTDPKAPTSLISSHARVRRFLKSSKFTLLLYNPFLRRDFKSLVEAQWAEFVRLYGQQPSHVDGHQHLHLCSNMLFARLIPAGTKVRRSFSFGSGEKAFFNRAYRAWVDRRLSRRYRLTHFFFDLSQHLPVTKLDKIVGLAKEQVVEMMTHPERPAELNVLQSREYADALGGLKLHGYADLNSKTG